MSHNLFIIYKFVIWFGMFDAMRAKSERAATRTRKKNGMKRKEEERKRSLRIIHELPIIFFIFLFFSCLFFSRLLHFEYVVSFAPLYLTDGNSNSDKFCETPPDIHTQLVLNYADNSNPCISSLIAINFLISRREEKKNNDEKEINTIISCRSQKTICLRNCLGDMHADIIYSVANARYEDCSERLSRKND